MQNRVLRACVDCGEVMEMYTFQRRCKTCAYLHQKELQRERYYAGKLPGQENYMPREKSKNWPVKFLQKGGGWVWQVTFKNTVTDRIVTIGAAQVFATADKAREDYVKAMR